MPRFRLRPEVGSVDLYRPGDDVDSIPVDEGDVIDVPANLVAEGAPEDAYLVGVGDDQRAWPKAVWELVEDQAASAVPDVEED